MQHDLIPVTQKRLMKADVSGKTERRTLRPRDGDRAGPTNHVSNPLEQVVGLVSIVVAEALGHGIECLVDTQQDRFGFSAL